MWRMYFLPQDPDNDSSYSFAKKLRKYETLPLASQVLELHDANLPSFFLYISKESGVAQLGKLDVVFGFGRLI